MIFLLLCIISSTLIVLLFKYIEKFEVHAFSAIVVNYVIATCLGYLLNEQTVSINSLLNESWLSIAIVIGVLFVIMFYFTGRSIQTAGVSVTTVAGRMSVILPITFSIIYDSEDLQLTKMLGIIAAVVAVVLTVYRKPKKNFNRATVFLPLSIFLGLGIVDILVKYAQSDYVTTEYASVFSAVLFSISCIVGIIIALLSTKIQNELMKLKTIVLGSLLGVANFGSIYFILKALNTGGLEGSVVFGVNNIGIVFFAVILAYVLFKEKLSAINYIGILFSLLAVYLLMYASM